MFKSHGGHVGLAPLSTACGDEICVVIGSSLPLVLRKKDNDVYQVIGPCYISGLQEGDAIL